MFASDTLHVAHVRLKHVGQCERSPQTRCTLRTFASDIRLQVANVFFRYGANVLLRHVGRCRRSLQTRCMLQTFALDTFANIRLRHAACCTRSPQTRCMLQTFASDTSSSSHNRKVTTLKVDVSSTLRRSLSLPPHFFPLPSKPSFRFCRDPKKRR